MPSNTPLHRSCSSTRKASSLPDCKGRRAVGHRGSDSGRSRPGSQAWVTTRVNQVRAPLKVQGTSLVRGGTGITSLETGASSLSPPPSLPVHHQLLPPKYLPVRPRPSTGCRHCHPLATTPLGFSLIMTYPPLKPQWQHRRQPSSLRPRGPPRSPAPQSAHLAPGPASHHRTWT